MVNIAATPAGVKGHCSPIFTIGLDRQKMSPGIIKISSHPQGVLLIFRAQKRSATQTISRKMKIHATTMTSLALKSAEGWCFVMLRTGNVNTGTSAAELIDHSIFEIICRYMPDQTGETICLGLRGLNEALMMDGHALPRREFKEPIMARTELTKLIITTLKGGLNFACASCANASYNPIKALGLAPKRAPLMYLVLTLTISIWDLEELSCYCRKTKRMFEWKKPICHDSTWGGEEIFLLDFAVSPASCTIDI